MSSIMAIIWQGNRKWYTIAAVIVIGGLMMYFGDNTAWMAE